MRMKKAQAASNNLKELTGMVKDFQRHRKEVQRFHRQLQASPSPTPKRQGSVLIQGYWGLGDNFFQRPFIRAAAARRDVWLITAWPQLYYDIPHVHFALSSTSLRTQTKNMQRLPATIWTEPPEDCVKGRMFYYPETVMTMGSITRCFESQVPLRGSPYDFSIRVKPSWIVAASDILRQLGVGDHPLAIVRPNTIRTEWVAMSRSPKNEYLTRLTEEFKRRGFFTLGIADLVDGAEWLHGEDVPVDARLYRGELSVEVLMGMISLSNATLGGVGFLQPMSMAVGTPTFCLYGGFGYENTPKGQTDPRMPLHLYGYACPSPQCQCKNMSHHCDKTISEEVLMSRFNAWYDSTVQI